MFVSSRSGHRFPSKEYKEFKAHVAEWHATKEALCKEASSLLKPHMANPMLFVWIDVFLMTPPNYIWTLDHRKKRWDGSNRQKAVHDAISGVIDIDDCNFQSGPCLKVVGPDHADKFCIIELSIKRIPTFQELAKERGWIA